MNNSLDYQTYYSARNPGLWILLTDEEEESINPINRFINNCIQENLHGNDVVNRCYIHIIGINGAVHRIASGYLSDLADNPIEIIKTIKRVPDGSGGLIEINCDIPIWCKRYDVKKELKLWESLKSIRTFLKEWLSANPDSPAPIVWNVSSKKIENVNVSRDVQNAINHVKAIKCKDGNVLYCNVFPSQKNDVFLVEKNKIVQMSSFIPSSYVYNFRYAAKYDFGIDHKIIGKFTHMSFHMSIMDRLIVPIMGWLSEPRLDMELIDEMTCI